jgi:hypothetical protein
LSVQLIDCPGIHVSLLPGADASLLRWVEIGAEEEGVPTRQVPGEANDLASLAYQAAQSSRLNIGVGISAQAVALHEVHMPVVQPVLVFKFSQAAGPQAPQLCRLMGANAARMVVRRPLHVDVNFPSPSASHRPQIEETRFSVAPELDPAQLAKIVALVVQKLRQRGM